MNLLKPVQASVQTESNVTNSDQFSDETMLNSKTEIETHRILNDEDVKVVKPEGLPEDLRTLTIYPEPYLTKE